MSRSSTTVEILLSTFNGAPYLDAQLGSIVSQEFTDWSLLVRDDASTDRSTNVVEGWMRRYPDKIRWLGENTDRNVGALRSFSTLLEHSTARYVMFCDQDDVWLADKVRVTFEAMRQQEERRGADCPVLVHTDLKIVDDDLRVLGESHWRHQGLVPRADRGFGSVMVENCVWGCTAMLNRPLVAAVGAIPQVALHHDWWIALVAAAFGRTAPLERQTILYRRHGRNESEISNMRAAARAGLANWRLARGRVADLLGESRPPVAAFLNRYRSRMRGDQIAAAEAFLRLPAVDFLTRRLDILRHGLVFSGLPRTLGMLLLV